MSDQKTYDTIYSKGGHKGEYFKHYSLSRYHPMWDKAASWIKEINQPPILDIGCGVGQFAHLLYDRKAPVPYLGIDLSAEAIRRTPKFEDYQFHHLDVFDLKFELIEYKTVCLLEVLEHLEADRSVIQRIASGTPVICSVPNYDSPTHVRYFKGMADVIQRYWDLLAFERYHTFDQGEGKKIFLFKTTRK